MLIPVLYTQYATITEPVWKVYSTKMSDLSKILFVEAESHSENAHVKQILLILK